MATGRQEIGRQGGGQDFCTRSGSLHEGLRHALLFCFQTCLIYPKLAYYLDRALDLATMLVYPSPGKFSLEKSSAGLVSEPNSTNWHWPNLALSSEVRQVLCKLSPKVHARGKSSLPTPILT